MRRTVWRGPMLASISAVHLHAHRRPLSDTSSLDARLNCRSALPDAGRATIWGGYEAAVQLTLTERATARHRRPATG